MTDNETRPSVLYVCVHNAGRSQMAAAYTQHLSGGAGGLAHVLEHLHPGTEALWADLGSPTMTPELADRLVTQVTDAVPDPAALLARRDAVIRAALEARRSG